MDAMSKEIENRLAKANSTFSRLNKRVWKTSTWRRVQRLVCSLQIIHWFDFFFFLQILKSLKAIFEGHAAEDVAVLGRSTLQDRGLSPTQDRPLQWTCYWSSQQRSTNEEILRLFEEIPWCVSNWQPPMVLVSLRSGNLETYHSSGCQLLWAALSQSWRQKELLEKSCHCNTELQSFYCSLFGRMCLSRIGLVTHKHRQHPS